MKISELKQPYRRMAEYLADKKIVQNSSYGIYNFFTRGGVMDLFCNSVDKGSHPEITEEIKRHFPSDFDFSGEEQPLQIPNNPIIQNRIYTQLAKEGKDRFFNTLEAWKITNESSAPVPVPAPEPTMEDDKLPF